MGNKILEDLKAKLESLKSKIDSKNSRISSLNSRIEKKNGEITDLREEIVSVEATRKGDDPKYQAFNEMVDADIKSKNKRITQKENEIKQEQEKIEQEQENIKELEEEKKTTIQNAKSEVKKDSSKKIVQINKLNDKVKGLKESARRVKQAKLATTDKAVYKANDEEHKRKIEEIKAVFKEKNEAYKEYQENQKVLSEIEKIEEEVLGQTKETTIEKGAEEAKAPVEEAKAPVEEAKAPAEEAKAPVEEAKTPVEEDVDPATLDWDEDEVLDGRYDSFAYAHAVINGIIITADKFTINYSDGEQIVYSNKDLEGIDYKKLDMSFDRKSEREYRKVLQEKYPELSKKCIKKLDLGLVKVLEGLDPELSKTYIESVRDGEKLKGLPEIKYLEEVESTASKRDAYVTRRNARNNKDVAENGIKSNLWTRLKDIGSGLRDRFMDSLDDRAEIRALEEAREDSEIAADEEPIVETAKEESFREGIRDREAAEKVIEVGKAAGEVEVSKETETVIREEDIIISDGDVR